VGAVVHGGGGGRGCRGGSCTRRTWSYAPTIHAASSYMRKKEGGKREKKKKKKIGKNVENFPNIKYNLWDWSPIYFCKISKYVKL
jgi:hypothetical protein